MTTANLQFAIDAVNSRVYIGAIHAPIITDSLESNINYLSFAGGVGQILYNDRPPMAETFSDPSPYQSFVDIWITAIAAASPALTLAEAQAVKNAFVAGIWQYKRQTPVAVAVTGGTFNFDASDDSIPQYALLSGYMMSGQFNTMSASLNAMIGALDQWAGNHNGLASEIPAMMDAAIDWMNINVVQPQFGSTWPYPGFSMNSDSGLGQSFPAFNPTIQTVPVGGTAPLTITAADLQAIILAVNSQRVREEATNNAKQAEVNALTTIAAVAAYDATTGW